MSPPSGALPPIIQGGMGVAVSNWRLARAVSMAGQLGVVSGTALDRVCAHRLQEGDPGGHARRVLASFPFPALARRVLDRWFRPEGLPAPGDYWPLPMQSHESGPDILALIVVGNYTEVALAKEGHGGVVGINLLEKIQLPNIASLYGAMLAGVDVVLMGAGIPRGIPDILRLLSTHAPAELRIPVPQGEPVTIRFDPRGLTGADLPPLRVPRFLPVIASVTLAQSLVRSCPGGIDGFIVEGPIAGGHNAPPRGGAAELNARGEPIYGPRDVVDLQRLAAFGLPFWLAGGYGRPGGLAAAKAQGAQGIQVGTAFAFCNESGIDAQLKRQVLAGVAAGTVVVRTDPLASPTGFPFKVVGLPGTMGTAEAYAGRQRICNIGLLRTPYRTPTGDVGWRCPAEPEAQYIAKGGTAEDAAGRVCLCNGLMSTAGHPLLTRDRKLEPGLLTAGDELVALGRILPISGGYDAATVLAMLLA